MSDQPPEWTEGPKVSIKLDLSPSTYHFSNPTPPTLYLTLTSQASRAITISIPYGSPLDPKNAMSHGAFPIVDLTTSPPTPIATNDLHGRINRRPSPNRLLTLLPGEPTSLSVAFTRGGSYDPKFRPQPWEIVRRGILLDENGNELNIRRSKSVSGVDGLKAGKRYRATVAIKYLYMEWWWGTESERRSGKTVISYGDDEQVQIPLAWEIEGVEFQVEE